MSTYEQHILLILGEATEPLFTSEITDRLNRELGDAYTMTEVVMGLKRLSEQVAQLPDGRWMLKRLML